jgi:hypothetical protein
VTNEQERRDHERRQVEVAATVSVGGHQTILKIRDLSDGGAFLKKGDEPLPPQGSEVFVEIAPISGGDDPMITRAEVVHVTSEGIGIVFLE